MPRYARIVVPGCAHHITQRGNHRQIVFHSDEDRTVYLNLVRMNAADCNVHLFGFCLMPNHVHWIARPEYEAGLAKAFGRAHYRYSNYFQARLGTTGHLWQNRFYSCPLSSAHLRVAMLYVEQNPIRAGMVRFPEDYVWSSARAHTKGYDPAGVVDAHWWTQYHFPRQWQAILHERCDDETGRTLERYTFAGKPYGDREFVNQVGHDTDLDVVLRRPGRPCKVSASMRAELENC